MTRILRLTCLSCLVSMLGFAGELSGWLVDSKCFASLWSFRSTPEVSWDSNSAIRYCSPEKKTHSFAVVRQDDGSPLSFDPAGNEKALNLRVNAADKFAYLVNITGQTDRHMVYVRTISISRRFCRSRNGAPGL
jgi:hypothetical protein